MSADEQSTLAALEAMAEDARPPGRAENGDGNINRPTAWVGTVPTDSAQAALHAALAAAQGQFPTIPRDRTVRVQTKTGGSYTFSYAPLDTILGLIRPVLAEHGLAITQLLDVRNGQTGLRTVLLHTAGGSLESLWPLAAGGSPQEFGSALTYLRRYTLVALLGIATEEDDDGNHASGNQATPQGRTGATETPTPDSRKAQDAGTGRTAPTASSKQVGLINGLMHDLEDLGVAPKETAVAFALTEYGVTDLTDLTGGRDGQASDLITRLQFRLADKLLHVVDDKTACVDILAEHGALTLNDVAADKLGAVAGDLRKLWKAQT